jgi:hypothetical protein
LRCSIRRRRGLQVFAGDLTPVKNKYSCYQDLVRVKTGLGYLSNILKNLP